MIAEINITKAILLTISITITTITASYGEKSVMFVTNKVIAQTNNEMMTKRK